MGAEEPDESGKPKPPRPVRPAPARGRDIGGARPVPVRAVVGEPRPETAPVEHGAGEKDPAAAAEPGPEPTRCLRAEGIDWTVRVRGSGRAGPDTGATPLLLLGFFDGPASPTPAREALVVARGLDALTDRQIEGAFRVARPPATPGAREFFPEVSPKGRRDDA